MRGYCLVQLSRIVTGWRCGAHSTRKPRTTNRGGGALLTTQLKGQLSPPAPTLLALLVTHRNKHLLSTVHRALTVFESKGWVENKWPGKDWEHQTKVCTALWHKSERTTQNKCWAVLLSSNCRSWAVSRQKKKMTKGGVSGINQRSGPCWITLMERSAVKEGRLTRAGYHVVFFLSPVATPSTQTTLPNRSSFCRWSQSSSSLEDEDNSSSWLWRGQKGN